MRSSQADVAIARRRRGRGSAQRPAQARLRPRPGPGPRVNRPRDGHSAERRGRGAETLACWYLRLHGWQILARRARVPGGEVDIVARRWRPLALIEVEARETDQ